MKGGEEISSLSDEELEHARDLGGITFLSSYTHLMCRRLGIDDSDNAAINMMSLEMIDTVNLGTEVAWCALMGDNKSLQDALERIRNTAETLANKKNQN